MRIKQLISVALLLLLGLTAASAKKFHHYSPTLAFLCDDERR